MTDKDHPHLRVVGEDEPEREDPLFPRSRPSAPAPSLLVAVVPRVDLAFARIPLSWMSDPAFPGNAATRLLVALLCRSREGARAVRLTGAFAGELGMDRRTLWRVGTDLERAGWIELRREGFHVLKAVVLRSAQRP
jgi:hypothetical protein